MPNVLPLSGLVSTSVNLAPQAAQAQNTSSLLILGSSEKIDVVQRFLTFTSLAEMVADGFLMTSPEYLAAQSWFSQSPAPTSVLVGRWVKTASKGQLIGGVLSPAEQIIASWNVIIDGSFKVTVDGGVEQSIIGLDFSLSADMSGVASEITAGLTGAICTWDEFGQQFYITSVLTGATSSISVLTAGAAGTTVHELLKGTLLLGAYRADGLVAEAAEAAATLFDGNYGQQFYGLVMPEASVSEHQAVAATVEAMGNKHIYGITTQDPNSLVANATSDIGYLVAASGYNRTTVQYSSSSAYAVASLLGRILTTNYNANKSVITLMYKQEPGITAEQLNSTQANALAAKSVNVFVAYNNQTSIIQNGVMASGQFIDTVVGTDWLALTLQTSLYNQLYTSPTKIPQTDAGVNILQSAIEGVCFQAVQNGLLSPGVWNQAGFGSLAQGDFVPKGYYIYAAPISSQTSADRAARKAPVFQIAAKLAGAVHTADILINVNP